MNLKLKILEIHFCILMMSCLPEGVTSTPLTGKFPRVGKVKSSLVLKLMGMAERP